MQSKIKCAVAFLVAGIYCLFTLQFRRMRGTITTLWGNERVSDELKERRLVSCSVCPLYYKPLETCGSPFMVGQPGCWCHMPTKAGYKINCWLYDYMQGLNLRGWPRELNSFPL